jgi:tryptophan-rich sensory protein
LRDSIRLIVSLAVPQLVGITAALATAAGVREWYPGLVKPGFTPPGWIFGPAWTLLYLLMGVALWLVWRSADRRDDTRPALVAFAVQLALNGLWSLLFFGLRSPGLAFAEILLLWAAIAVTIVLFRRVSRLAAALLLPYWLWVTFAAVLNGSIWWLNA